MQIYLLSQAVIKYCMIYFCISSKIGFAFQSKLYIKKSDAENLDFFVSWTIIIPFRKTEIILGHHTNCLKGPYLTPPPQISCLIKYNLLRSAMAGRLYKHHSKHTSNSGFDLTFMPCSCYILFAADQRAGYQISWVDPQREVNCP